MKLTRFFKAFILWLIYGYKKALIFIHKHNWTRFWAFVSVVMGSIFLVGFFSASNLVENSFKWTSQSNWLALLVAFLYLFFPKSVFFRYNTIIVIIGNNLFLAGIGFWLFLFPTAFFGYLGYVSNLSDASVDTIIVHKFFYIWDHTVTQVFYLIFMISAFKKSSDQHMLCTRLSTLMLISLVWITTYIAIFFVSVPFVTNYFPVYGIFTNFNASIIYKAPDDLPLYNWKLSLLTVLVFYTLIQLLAFFAWRIAIPFNERCANHFLEKVDSGHHENTR